MITITTLWEVYNNTTVIQCSSLEIAEALLVVYENTTNPLYQGLTIRSKAVNLQVPNDYQQPIPNIGSIPEAPQ